jgi:hypothetical protein
MRRSITRASLAGLAVAAAVAAIGPMTSNASAMTGLVGPTSGTKPVTTSVTSVAALMQDDLADAEDDLRRGAFNQALEHLGDFEQHKDAALGAGWV